jgi:hypothetical protein
MNAARSLSTAAVSLIAVLNGVAEADVGDRLARIRPDDLVAGDGFGTGVAIRGDLLLVGSPVDDAAGSAYLYDISDPTAPDLLAKLVAEDREPGDNFGQRTAIGDGVVFVQSLNDGPGSVYVFDISKRRSPRQTAKMVPADGVGGDQFGRPVKVSGDFVFGGASRDDDRGTDSGSVCIFNVSDPTDPVELPKILASDGSAGDWFGATIEVDGDIAVVGAHRDQGGRGSLYVYDVTDPANPVELDKFEPVGASAGDNFARQGDLEGRLAVLDAPFDDDMGSNAGAVYIVDVSDPVNPEQLAKILAPDGAPGDRLSRPAVRGDLLVCGALGDIPDGSAYFFDISRPREPVLLTKVCGNPGDLSFGSQVEDDGDLVVISARDTVYLFDASFVACVADINDDDAVGFADLVAVLAAWGPCAGDCPEDLDGSGTVDFVDLLVVLGAWGPCE